MKSRTVLGMAAAMLAGLSLHAFALPDAVPEGLPAAIEGKVVDAAGGPVADARVTIMELK